MIPPGQAGKIKASVRTESFRGAIAKSMTVTHDDPAQGAVILTVKATVVGSVNILPFPSMAMAPRQKGFGSPASLIIRRDDAEKGELAVSDLTCSAPWIKLTLRTITEFGPIEPGLPDGRPGDVVISGQVTGKPPIGIHAESIRFKTGLTREPDVSIPVHVTVRPPLYFQPTGDLVLAVDPTGTGRASGQLAVTVREDLDLATFSASATPPFTARFERQGRAAVRVSVDWAGDGPAPAIEGDLHMSVGDETATVRVRLDRSPDGSVPRVSGP